MTAIPEVLWAQRSSSSDESKNVIFLTIATPDVTAPKVDLSSTGLKFSGSNKKADYELELEFWGEIDVAKSKTHHTARDVELVLQKKEAKDEYWPRLLKTDKKQHFLKTNFDKWVDEDEQDEVEEAGDGGMGGMPGMGMPGMEGMGGMGGMDFSSMGMGGLDFSKMAGGMGDMGDMDDMDDDEMPDLEGEEKKPGIEEIP